MQRRLISFRRVPQFCFSRDLRRVSFNRRGRISLAFDDFYSFSASKKRPIERDTVANIFSSRETRISDFIRDGTRVKHSGKDG